MSDLDNIFINVRARLQSEGVKLWEEPYYSEELGSIEGALENLAKEYSRSLGFNMSRCKFILTELQENALRKLAARREFSATGLATFKVRRIDNRSGTTNMLDIKCDLNALGSDLQAIIAEKLQLPDKNHVKCIAAGRMVAANATLAAQQLKNNQQLIVIVGDGDNHSEALYERINRIKADVLAVVSSQNRLVEMEDQNGSAVFLPPAENRALLIGLGFCEKARAAMLREDFEEALLLLLEADESFATCDSQFLESVDNYALLNLDIVWCYLCLKNVTQLPDAERRLDVCGRNFRRSYGEKFERLYLLKGKTCPERALIMRLQLLQGVVMFHQNRRDEAFERFEAASMLLRELKVNADQLALLVEMGFEETEARLGLRSCESNGNVEQAVQFIQERRQQLKDARTQSKAERALQRRLMRCNANDSDWVNPRSVCTLTEMGFERALAILALQRSENDLPKAVELLQTESDALRAALPQKRASADTVKLAHLLQLGFNEDNVRVALETTSNDIERAIECLLRAFQNEDELKQTMDRVSRMVDSKGQDLDGPSTSNAQAAPPLAIIDAVLKHARSEIETYKAYERFNADLSQNDMDYLDLPLVQEEKILAEYLKMLQQ
ncbi:NEDD8 ultimate buster 1 isoform X1 [Drosophila elegans]|uniref:NEDD8 ultimate buster 1 isoform X1 n=1 Tax=Drosophila elegans TaxID=30023 RepID=UPI0007E8AF6A|nr:NEDD8 ultimate buster 1 isoform X1 [Drosophila elegans]